MADSLRAQRALISVSDKTDIVALARRMVSHGIEILSTGGTARALVEAGIEVTPVEAVTGFPEMMDGRVKTLHPAIHGGLLALRDKPDHVQAMDEHDIAGIDILVVNLYPFEQTIARPDVTDEQAIEQIDIGGPAMIRSGAKNHRFVAVVTAADQYDRLAAELDAHDGGTTLGLRRQLALEAFARTSRYDHAISTWMSDRVGEAFPPTLMLRMERDPLVLRYGENPHQAGALYVDPAVTEASVVRSRQLHGKALSFCNLYDANGALELVKEIDGEREAAAAVIKHANPCGFAVATDLPTAFQKAYQGDPLAAFGGIVAVNRPMDLATARAIVEGERFLEVILAPSYDDEALELLKARWKNVRLLEVGALPRPDQREPGERDMKRMVGGLLVQDRDLAPLSPEAWRHAAGPAPSSDQLAQMRLALIAVRHLKSNAVCIVNDGMLVGAGAGQMDRVAACRNAIDKAGDRAVGGVVGSDAFFPFRDGPDRLIAAGVKAIAQTGGSVRDDDTIAACNEAGVTLMLTGVRLFRH